VGIVSNPLSITIEPLPIPFAGNDQNICDTHTTLEATVPPFGHIGYWTVISGAATFSNSGSANSVVTNLAKGPNRLLWTVQNVTTGCISNDEVIITNNQLAVSVSAGSSTVCNGAVNILQRRRL
jgi:hypothetical protein